MATVHLGRLSGPAGFSRTVAIKRLHANFAKDPEFVAMFLDEARLAARVRHANVVPTLDVVAMDGEVFLVMDYVHGESLAKLRRAMVSVGKPATARIISTVMSGVLHGLHAAHEAVNEQGQPLNIVHRDVSPQNIIIGIDGAPRVLDFGVAKAIGRVQTTVSGRIKGKLGYMPPEQLQGGPVTRQTDVYAASVVTWEMLTGRRLFRGDSEGAVVTAILRQEVEPPSVAMPHLSKSFDRVVMRGLERDPANRYASAREMALDLERCAGVASASEVGEWVQSLCHIELLKRAELIAEIEDGSSIRASQASIAGASELPTASAAAVSPAGTLAPAADVSHIAMAPGVGPSGRRSWFALVTGVVGLCLGAALLMAINIASVGGAPRGLSTGPDGRTATGGSVGLAPVAPPPDVVIPIPLADPTPLTVEPRENPPPPAHVSRAPPVKAPKRDCDQPFTIDERGHKHYKAACL